MYILPTEKNRISNLKHVRIGSISLLFEYEENVSTFGYHPYYGKEFGFKSELFYVKTREGVLVWNENSGDDFLFESKDWENLQLIEKHLSEKPKSQRFRRKRKRNNFFEIIGEILSWFT